MKLRSLRIKDFRGIPDLELDFSKQVNVLIGINGVGKTAVLDCAAIMLSRLIGRIRSSQGTGRFFRESDITNGLVETGSEIRIEFQGQPVQWSVSKTRRGRKKQTITGLSQLRQHVESFRSTLEGDESLTLPLVVYYPVNRAVLDIPLRVTKRHEFDRLAAYDLALSGGSSNFRIFFEWFRDREDLENETRLDVPEYRDPQLRAVRRACELLLPGFHGLKVRRSPLRMVIDKDGQEIVVNQLSDGEKSTLALAGDLARRLAIANPHLDDPLAAEAVVLIDEIDLHMHPAWQRRVVAALKAALPNGQFLLSTHSPQILSHLDRDSIWIMERTTTGVSAVRPEQSFGQTSNRVLEDMMNVPARPQEIQEQLDELFLAIERSRFAVAKTILKQIRDLIGRDADLVKAAVMIDRKELIET